MNERIATKGNATFMLKQSSILKKKKKAPKVYQADYDIFQKGVNPRQPISYGSSYVTQSLRVQEYDMQADK